MARVNDMKVTSHVGRDLLASAAAFKTEAAVVWEYVVNSLQYTDRGAIPRVAVIVAQMDRAIAVIDNGKGMTAEGLQHFFQMHGENLDRLRGRPGRGKFGTGKSAAFGIAGELRVETVRDGVRNVARLTRAMIEQSAGKEIPLDWCVRNESTAAQNGTTVHIGDVFLKQIRTAPIIDYIERHLQAFRAISPEVAVNDHVCSYREPEIESQYEFTPSAEQAETLGNVTLLLKVARAPLPDAEQGVVITAGPGNLVAVEKAGIENKEFGAYLLGEIDVPALENPQIPIEPYDSSRSMVLNLQHPVASVLVGFIGAKLEHVRTELVRRAKDARRGEQARRMELHAKTIADLLNADFNGIRDRLTNIRGITAKSGSTGAQFGGSGTGDDSPDSWIEGTQQPGAVTRTPKTGRHGDGQGRAAPSVVASGQQDPAGNDAIDPAGAGQGTRARPRGAFQVVYRNLGRSEHRSRYDERSLSILINLDHPVLAIALTEGGVDEPGFRRLSYEIAFSEYAMALGYELLKHDPNMPGDDVLYEVRSSLNRVAGAAASLYR